MNPMINAPTTGTMTIQRPSVLSAGEVAAALMR